MTNWKNGPVVRELRSFLLFGVGKPLLILGVWYILLGDLENYDGIAFFTMIFYFIKSMVQDDRESPHSSGAQLTLPNLTKRLVLLLFIKTVLEWKVGLFVPNTKSMLNPFVEEIIWFIRLRIAWNVWTAVGLWIGGLISTRGVKEVKESKRKKHESQFTEVWTSLGSELGPLAVFLVTVVILPVALAMYFMGDPVHQYFAGHMVNLTLISEEIRRHYTNLARVVFGQYYFDPKSYSQSKSTVTMCHSILEVNLLFVFVRSVYLIFLVLEKLGHWVID